MIKIQVGAILRLLIVIGLAAGIALAGCSNDNAATNAETGDAAAEPSAATTPAQEPAVPAVKGDIAVSIYDRGNVPAEEGTPDNNRWTEWIQEHAPANVKFIPVPRFEEAPKYNTLFATGDAPDLLFTWTPSLINSLYAQNLLMPMDDVIDQYSTEYKALLEKYPVLKKIGTKADGKMYALSAIAPVDVDVALLARADWLERLNLDVPATTEDFYQVIKAFREQDPDGNGQQDTYGFALSHVGGQISDYLFGAGATWKIIDGEYMHTWEAEAAASAFRKRLYDDGLVDRDFLTDQDGEKAKQEFLTGKLGMYATFQFTSSSSLNLYKSFKQNNPDGELIVIPLPRSEFGQFSPDVSPPFYTSAVVTATTKNPQAVVQYIDFLLQEPVRKTLKYGIEGVHWQADANGCAVPIDAEKNQKEKDWAYDFSMLDQPIVEGVCADFLTQLNMDDPLEQQYAELVKSARESYLSPDRPLYYDINWSSIPPLPDDLELIMDTVSDAYIDVLARAVVSGPSYPIDKAIEDAKATWEQGGGQAVDDFFKQWYAENKDVVVYTKDYLTAK